MTEEIKRIHPSGKNETEVRRALQVTDQNFVYLKDTLETSDTDLTALTARMTALEARVTALEEA